MSRPEDVVTSQSGLNLLEGANATQPNTAGIFLYAHFYSAGWKISETFWVRDRFYRLYASQQATSQNPGI